MQIKFNEIDISINRSENTIGAYQFHLFQFPSCSTAQKKFIMPSQSLMERLQPPWPTATSLHRRLLYVIEIDTSIKIGLLLGTKESDILE